jgi:hypothetical protein
MSRLTDLIEGLRTGLPMPGPIIKRSFKPDDYYYHVTLFENLKHIASDGLSPRDSVSGVKGAFMSDRPGVPRWFKWANKYFYREAAMGYRGKSLYPSVPVVLRFSKSMLKVHPDDMGHRDTVADMVEFARNYAPNDFEGLPGDWSITAAYPPEGYDWDDWDKIKKKLKVKAEPLSKAYYSTNGVPAQMIKVYNGYQWVPISKWKRVDPSKGIGPQATLKPPERNPLIPTL